LRGSAIVEAAAVEGAAGRLATLITPRNEFVIARAGAYRINVIADGSSRVVVEKGKMLIGGVELKEGKLESLLEGPPVVRSAGKNSEDAFDIWSKERSASLVAANKDLRKRPSFLSSITFLQFPFRPCRGLWLFDPFFGGFLYLPDAFDSCSPLFSGYGFSYAPCNP